MPDDKKLYEELNGYKLMQPRQDVSRELGEPVTTVTNGGLVYEAYCPNDSCQFYVGHLPDYPKNVFALQISGSSPQMPLVNGVRLGSSVGDVFKAFGEPVEAQRISGGKILLEYSPSSNISFEIDGGNVSSIRISFKNDLFTLFESQKERTQILESFLQRIVDGDPDKIAAHLHPFCEIMLGDESLMVGQSFEAFRETPNVEFMNALRLLPSGVEGYEPRFDIRMDSDFGIGINYKFDEPCPVEKVTFMPFNGYYRLYELWLRKP